MKKGQKANAKKNSSGYKNRNPRRGGPGVLVTCERGREFKTQREAIEILTHYFYQTNNKTLTCVQETPSDNERNGAENKDNISWVQGKKQKTEHLSLEEEISMLKNGANVDEVLLNDRNNLPKVKKGKKKNNIFTNYDTGCHGCVFLMCTLPEISSLIEQTQRVRDASKNESSIQKTHDAINDDVDVTLDKAKQTDVKKRKLEIVDIENKILKEENTTSSYEITKQALSIWDPLQNIQSILGEAKESSTTNLAPSSRYITRIIPIQATCFANINEIKQTAKDLIDHWLPSNQNKHDNIIDSSVLNDSNDSRITFAINSKRRNCSNVTRDQIISTVASLVDDTKYKVSLKNPKFTILIEICRTLCGISIVKDFDQYDNFNLFEIRQKLKQEQT